MKETLGRSLFFLWLFPVFVKLFIKMPDGFRKRQ